MPLPINVDCGENFGNYNIYPTKSIIEYADLINVACGFHAGDATNIISVISDASITTVKVGAHPSFPDLQGFGRRYMDMPFDELRNIITFQIASIAALCELHKIKMHHVKAHGALYNSAVYKEKEAKAIVDACSKYGVKLLAPEKSLMKEMGELKGIEVIYEAFADRLYNSDLSLVNRNNAGAVFSEETAIKSQFQNICNGFVIDADGNRQSIKAHSICVHGEHANIISILKTLKN